MLFMFYNLVLWLSPSKLMQMTQKRKEKAPKPELKKKSRIEKQQEREEQATRAMLAQEARQGRGHGGALRITERD